MNEFDNRIEELLQKYTFDNLSNSDKDYVLSEMSALEYNHLHKIVQVAKYEYNDTDLNLPPNIKTLIKKDLKNRWPRQKTWTTILTPFLWISLGALLMHIIWNRTNGHSHQEPVSLPIAPLVDTVYIKLRDTIEIESPPIVQIKEIIKYREVKAEELSAAAPTNSISNQDKYVDSRSNSLPTKISLNEASSFNHGESISNEEELMDLLTPILSDRLD